MRLFRHSFHPVAVALLTASSISFAQAADNIVYQIFVDNGKQAGEQRVSQSADGELTVHYVFKDNGRGPELTEHIRLNQAGLPIHYQATGKTTFGSTIDEQFNYSNHLASWRTGATQAQATSDGRALYLAVDGSLQLSSIAISAMAKTGRNSLPLLPSGQLQQQVLGELLVRKGQQQQTVQLLKHTGIGLEPTLLWATTGDNPRLFAELVPGAMTFIEQGWQHNAPAMLSMQQRAETELLQQLASAQSQPLHGLTVVRNARIFDSERLTLSQPQDIYLLRGKITKIVDAGSLHTPVQHDVDAANRIVVPGLFDMHGHLSRWEGGLHIAAGVTTLRDMGNDNASLQQMIDEIADGQLLAPTVVATGFLEGESPYAARNGFVVSNLEAAKAAIDWYAAHGYPQLKIYNSFPKAILSETVAYAHQRGLRVSGHVPAFLKADDVIAAGFDEIQHINQLMLNFLVTPETDTRTLERFYLPAKGVADLDLNSKPLQDFIQNLKQHQVAVDPTLATFDFLKKVDGTVGEPWQAIVSHLPPDVQRAYARAELDIPDQATAQRYAKSYQKMVQFVGMLYQAGVTVVAGTDELAGFTLQGELELLVKAGLSPAQALQVATLNGAKLSGVSSHKGQIKQGFDADLLILDGDPTENISDIRKLALVITQGKAIVPAAVYQQLGITPIHQATVSQQHYPLPVATGGSSTARRGHRH